MDDLARLLGDPRSEERQRVGLCPQLRETKVLFTIACDRRPHLDPIDAAHDRAEQPGDRPAAIEIAIDPQLLAQEEAGRGEALGQPEEGLLLRSCARLDVMGGLRCVGK